MFALPPAVWSLEKIASRLLCGTAEMSDDCVCVCVFGDILYIHLCEGGQCMRKDLENIIAGFSMYKELELPGSESQSVSQS